MGKGGADLPKIKQKNPIRQSYKNSNPWRGGGDVMKNKEKKDLAFQIETYIYKCLYIYWSKF